MVLLFVVLTPGILLTIPPVGKKIFGSGKSSLIAACVHAVLFVVLLNLFNVEGFQPESKPSTSKPSKVSASNTAPVKGVPDLPSLSSDSTKTLRISAIGLNNTVTARNSSLITAEKAFNNAQTFYMNAGQHLDNSRNQFNKIVQELNENIRKDSQCMNLGCPSSDKRIRLYTPGDCARLGGDYNMSGECGSFSDHCIFLNNTRSPNEPYCAGFVDALNDAPKTGNAVTSYNVGEMMEKVTE